MLGVVQTLSFGQRREQHWQYLRSPETMCPGLRRPELRVYQRRRPSSPAEKRRDQREPGQVADHRPRDAATTNVTTAARASASAPAATAAAAKRQHRQADEQEHVVDHRRAEVAVQQIVRHAQSAAARAVQPVSNLNGQPGNRKPGRCGSARPT